ncbi:early activation antigen CD69-like [Erythrolamprus reginae]|uniref:early activation antigen CD69-like n=1 Tax=Erythrolamprus reginae TaxID=121349 RepID=UPI00396D0342
MQTMSVENQVLDPRPNESASEQQNKTVHFKAIKRRLLQPFDKHKKAAIALSCLIFSSASFGLGTLVSLNRQKEAIKCPPDWIGHQGHCYKFSTEEKNWKESQDFCILHDASLAKITGEEMYLVTKITRNNVFWIGLKRELDQPWKWLDGDNATLKVLGNGGDCAFLNDDGTASSGRCSTKHHYICKKIFTEGWMRRTLKPPDGFQIKCLGTLVPLNRQKEAIKCPSDWIGHHGHCYKFSREEKNWKESQDFCILHDASLAKITEEEMYLVTKITRNNVFWIGLKRELDQPWKWLDGDNATLKVLGNGGDCAFLNDDGTASSGRCSTEHHYICKKKLI